MAKIEFIKEAGEGTPQNVESLEVLVWGAGGTNTQEFVIGSGSNFNASTNFWIEVRYSVQGLPIFYTRNIFSHAWGDVCSGQLERLEEFVQGKTQGFSYGDMLPETGLSLARETNTYTSDGQEQTSSYYNLNIHLDFGAVFGHSSPGERMIEIQFPDIGLEEGLRFMRELVADLETACQGRHPDPGLLPPGFSDWPFARELNRRAYDQISVDYKEDYFAEPLLRDVFDNWLAQLPKSGSVLDAGCGHGDPVITRLLEHGCHVTGSDLSPAMLTRARAQFPQVEFWERTITEIQAESIFDGVCSFSSMLYLDQIDFFHSIHRVFRAMKAGGLLFLYGYDLHPRWRGQPYEVEIKQWMWGGTRSIEETTQAMEEHGYFKVLQTVITENEEVRQKKIAEWRIQAQKEHDEWLAKLDPSIKIQRTDYSNVTPRLGYPYVVVAQKQEK
jgi:SAM-dependent methyltransferase